MPWEGRRQRGCPTIRSSSSGARIGGVTTKRLSKPKKRVTCDVANIIVYIIVLIMFWSNDETWSPDQCRHKGFGFHLRSVPFTTSWVGLFYKKMPLSGAAWLPTRCYLLCSRLRSNLCCPEAKRFEHEQHLCGTTCLNNTWVSLSAFTTPGYLWPWNVVLKGRLDWLSSRG